MFDTLYTFYHIQQLSFRQADLIIKSQQYFVEL